MTDLYETDICKHCGKSKGRHQSKTFNCPIKTQYARQYAGFHKDSTFQPKLTRKKPKEQFTISEDQV